MVPTATRVIEGLVPSSRRDGFPVMAGALPLVGHAVSLHLDAVDVLRRAEVQHGPLAWLSLGLGRWYLFCFGAEGFELLKGKAAAVSGARGSVAYLLGNSLLTMDGAEHRRVREAMNPTFSARGLAETGAGATMAQVIGERVRDMVARGRVRIHEEAQRLALDVIFRVCGVEMQRLPEWHSRYRLVILGLVPFPVEWPGTPRYRALRATEWVNRELLSIVQRARREGEGTSIAHVLVRARDEDGRPLSDGELVDNLRVLFVAGHETTATVLAWATIELSRHPSLWERLCDEVAAAGVESGMPPSSLADAKRLPLCEAVFREAVRLYGPVWFLERRAQEAIDYRGHRIPAGTTIAACPPLWARDPALYPDPDAFEPDRWLGRKAPLSPMELSQFGGGAHFCLGYHLAWLESVQFLSALAVTVRRRGARLRLEAPGEVTNRLFPAPHPPKETEIVFQ